MLDVNVTELVYVLDLKSNGLGLKGSTPFIHKVHNLLRDSRAFLYY